MDKDILEQLQFLAGMMEKMATKEDLEGLKAEILTKNDVEPLSDRSASKAAALTEEKLGRRISSLFDGYKLTHEKQYELERKIEGLERRLEAIENRTAQKPAIF